MERPNILYIHSHDTGRYLQPYGLEFPAVTVADMVRAEKILLKMLGIERLLAATGGSLGGMQALEWALSYPDAVRSVVMTDLTP